MADPTGAVIFDENPDKIMYAPIDEPTVPPTLPDPPPTVPTQHKGRYMRPSRKANYSHLGNNDEGYYKYAITTNSSKMYATSICHLEYMDLTNYKKSICKCHKYPRQIISCYRCNDRIQQAGLWLYFFYSAHVTVIDCSQ